MMNKMEPDASKNFVSFWYKIIYIMIFCFLIIKHGWLQKLIYKKLGRLMKLLFSLIGIKFTKLLTFYRITFITQSQLI